MVSKQLQQGGELDIRTDDNGFTLWLEGQCVADSPSFADATSRDAAVQSLKLALAPARD